MRTAMVRVARVCRVAGMRVMRPVVGVANVAGASGVAPGVSVRSCVTAMPVVAAVREATQRHDGEPGAPCREGNEVEVHD
jgi:hypothetical protein